MHGTFEVVYVLEQDGTYTKYTVGNTGNWQRSLGGVSEKDVTNSVNTHNAIVMDTAPSGDATQPGNTYADFTGTAQAEIEEEEEANRATGEEMAGEEWGAANITKDMFVNPDGTQKSIQEVYATLDPILTGISGKELVNYIKDIFPKYTGVPAEEKEFAKEAYKADIYGLQPKIGEAATPTTGGGMRASIGAKAGVKKGFGAAGKAYEKSIYGLEKTAGAGYEASVLGAIGDMPEHTFAEAGTDALTTSWEDIDWTNMREGGRVPSKSETFLDFLTKLPDAGGM